MILSPVESQTKLLQRFGFPSSTLVDAILDGHFARSVCTPLHPRGYRGISGWATTVAGLRARLIPLGWTSVDTGRNLSTVVSPDGSVAIAVSSGDENTGNPDASPRTLNEKGEASREAVEANERQQQLFGTLPIVLKKSAVLPPGRTFWLLTHQRGERIHFEVSLPMAMDEDGRLTGWHERFLFEPIELRKPVGVDEKLEEFVVEVSRKK